MFRAGALILFLASSLLAAATTSPVVDELLTRAAADIRVSAKGPPTLQSIYPSEIELAIRLVAMRGSEDDRRLLRDMLANPRPMPASADPNAVAFAMQVLRAWAHAALGEMDPARAAIAEAEALAENTNEKLPFMKILVPMMLERGYVSIGDIAKARASAEKHAMFGNTISALTSLARTCDDLGNTAARDQLLADATKLAMAKSGDIELGSGLFSVADELIGEGRLAEAAALAAQMPAAYRQCDAWCNLAEKYFELADSKSASAALAKATEGVDGGKWPAVDNYIQITRTGAAIRDRDALMRAAAAAEKALAKQQSTALIAHPARLARDCAAVGEFAAAERFIAQAEAAIARHKDAADKARALVLIAAAHASSGHDDRAADAMKRSRALHQEKYEYSEVFPDYLRAYIDLGQSDRALALAKEYGYEGDDFDYIHEEIIRYHLRARRFDESRAAAMKLSRPNRQFAALSSIAGAQFRAGQTKAAAEWIATLPDPQLRAALLVILAQHQSGQGDRGLARTMRIR